MEIKRPESRQPMPDNAKKVFSGKIFDVYQWEQKMYDGTVATFEKLKRPDTVVVFPVLSDGKILLTEQEQPGKTPFIGAAGGRVEEGEDVLQAAKRELLEETGYEADEFILWDAQQPASKIDWAVYTFVAKGLKKVADLTLDGGEKIMTIKISFDEFLGMSKNMKFSEREIVLKLVEANFDKGKQEELRKLFAPK